MGTLTTTPDTAVRELVDKAVAALNNLVVHLLDSRPLGRADLTTPTLVTPGQWKAIVEADHIINTVQDGIGLDPTEDAEYLASIGLPIGPEVTA